MKLSQAGERRFIEHIRKRFSLRTSHPLAGIGDDAAVLKLRSLQSGRNDLLCTTDVLVEGVDFELRYCPFHQIGYKALAANLSDIAAMGGQPRFFLVSLGLSGNLEVDQLDELYEGMMDLAREYQVSLIGGDLSSTRGGIFVAVTVLGEIEKGLAVARSGARPGDRIFVTGTLGDAAAGLEMARAGRHLFSSWLPLIQRQFYPVPRIKEGRLIATSRLASSLIDLSDGLASDLRHICGESGVGAEVEAGALPLSESLRAYAKKVRKNPLGYALVGGEDFELLLTVPKANLDRFGRIFGKQGNIKVSQIGRILPKASGIRLRDNRGRKRPFPPRGYEHFV